MRSATVIGYHGMENFGDDIFLDITADLLVNKLGIKRIFLNARDTPAAIAKTYMLKPIHPEGYRIKRLDWIRQLFASARSDLVVFSAGSIFAGPQYAQTLLFARCLRLLNKVRGGATPVIGIGISLGPFPRERDRNITARGLALFDSLLLRDEVSGDEARRMGLPNTAQSFDIVTVLADKIFRLRASAIEKTAKCFPIGISLGPGYRKLEMDDWRQFGKELSDSLLFLSQNSPGKEVELRVLNTCSSDSDGDYSVAEALSKTLRGLGLSVRRVDYRSSRREEFLNSLLGCRALISSRLHPALVAMGAGIPVMQLFAVSPKITGVFGRIGLKPVVMAMEARPVLSQWQEFFSSVANEEFCSQVNADNQAAFRRAGALCRKQLHDVFVCVSRGVDNEKVDLS